MQMFIEITNREDGQQLHIDITNIRSYSIQETEDDEDRTIYLIVYALPRNVFIEEAFDSEADRDEKVDYLATLIP